MRAAMPLVVAPVNGTRAAYRSASALQPLNVASAPTIPSQNSGNTISHTTGIRYGNHSGISSFTQRSLPGNRARCALSQLRARAQAGHRSALARAAVRLARVLRVLPVRDRALRRRRGAARGPELAERRA